MPHGEITAPGNRSALSPVLPRRKKKVSFGLSTLPILTVDGRNTFCIEEEKASSGEALGEEEHDPPDRTELQTRHWQEADIRGYARIDQTARVCAPIYELQSPLHPASLREFLRHNGGRTTELPLEWQSAMQREEEERQKMCSLLDITDDELEEFQVVLSTGKWEVDPAKDGSVPGADIKSTGMMHLQFHQFGTGTQRWKQPSRGNRTRGPSPYRSVLRLPVFSAPALLSAKTRGAFHDQKEQTRKNRKENLHEAGDELYAAGLVSSPFLQASLRSSISSMHQPSSAVKSDVLSIPSLCRGVLCSERHSSARRRLQSWGAERLLNILDSVLFSYRLAALRKWTSVVKTEKKFDKFFKFVRYQGTRKILYLDNYLPRKRMAEVWVMWIDGVLTQRLAEKHKLLMATAAAIQCAWRSYQAVCVTKRLRNERRHRSALCLQRYARGGLGRRTSKEIRRQNAAEGAALKLQCFYRRMASRKILIVLKRRRHEKDSANLAQSIVRGHIGRKIAAKQRLEKKRHEAVRQAQRILRGRIGRRFAVEYRLHRQQFSAAVLIQKQSRIYLCKRHAARLKREKIRRLQALERTALMVQRVYRGHRGRLSVQLNMKARLSQIRKRNQAALTLCCWSRMIISKAAIRKMRNEEEEWMINESRRWQEMWSDDAQTWIYFKAETGESLWEPPETGYTKADSKLVLKNGRVVDDPLAPTDIVDDEMKIEIKCVDCDRVRASRLCDQCGDSYCTSCFEKAHPKGGKRESHTFIRVGSIECEECRAGVIAVRWCTSCDDPFCMICWETIHNTGNRARHSYCKIDTEGNVSPRAWETDGSSKGVWPGGMYKNMTNPQQGFRAHDTGRGNQSEIQHEGSQLGAGVHWSAHYDNNGMLYYYDETTGQSTYDLGNGNAHEVEPESYSQQNLGEIVPSTPAYGILDYSQGYDPSYYH